MVYLRTVIDDVSRHLKISESDCRLVILCFLNRLTDRLASDKSVSFQNFGVFECKKHMYNGKKKKFHKRITFRAHKNLVLRVEHKMGESIDNRKIELEYSI